MKSRSASSTQLLCYSRLSIYEGREKYIIDEAEPIEVFFSLRTDFEKLSPCPIFLWSWRWRWLRKKNGGGGLFAFGAERLVFFRQGQAAAAQIKAIVEMRMLSLAGFMPDLICLRPVRCL